jgi:hypothetical protein
MIKAIPQLKLAITVLRTAAGVTIPQLAVLVMAVVLLYQQWEITQLMQVVTGSQQQILQFIAAVNAAD